MSKFEKYLEAAGKYKDLQTTPISELRKLYLDLDEEYTMMFNQDDPVLTMDDIKKYSKSKLIHNIMKLRKEIATLEKEGF